MSPSSERVAPGSYVRVARTAQSRHAGRSGLCVGVAGDVVRVRFAAVRTFDFAVRDLEPLVAGPRRA